MFELGQPIRSSLIAFTSDTLPHAVTLTFDPLTLNVYSTGVM